MSVQFNPFKNFTPPKVPLNPSAQTQVQLKPQLKQDTFVKTSETSAVEKPKVQTDDEFRAHINDLYNQTFETVLAQNPIIKDLNYQKPELCFDNSKDDALASYDFTTNTVSFPNKIRQDFYAVIYNMDDGSKMPLQICPEKEAQQVISQQADKKLTVKKLSAKEKDFYISAAMAHELRHFVQSHVTASCEDTYKEHNKIYQEFAKSLQKSYQELVTLQKEYEEATGEKYDLDDPELDTKLILAKYSENYKPTTILPKGTKFKFSIHDDDNSYMLVKEHLLQSLKNKYANHSERTHELYTADPVEIDAYHYQKEFILSQVKEKNDEGNFSDEFMLGMLMETTRSFEDGLENLEKYGYPPLVNQ